MRGFVGVAVGGPDTAVPRAQDVGHYLDVEAPVAGVAEGEDGAEGG